MVNTPNTWPSLSVFHRLVICLAITCTTAAPAQADERRNTASPQVAVLAQPLTIPGLNRQRTLRVYVPPGYASSDKRYPVLYMHDGQNLFDAATAYAGEWGVDETLDALARTHRLELIVVGIDNGREKRMTELNPWDHERFGAGEGKLYMDFIVQVVKPLVDKAYRTLPGREHTGIMGSSMGGLISHYALLQYPSVFGKAGVFSPAYWPGPAVYDMTARQPPAPDARTAITMGGREGREATQGFDRMVTQLRSQSHPSTHLWTKFTPEAEHNEAAWRADFGDAVLWLFAPQR